MTCSGRVLLATLALVSAACARALPPPAIPSPTAPDLGPLPQPDKEVGRIVVDVVQGPTNVYQVDRNSSSVQQLPGQDYVPLSRGAQPLCTSPCAVDLAPGRYTLGFPTRGSPHLLEIDDVDIGPVAMGYRRALGRRDSSAGGLVLGMLGATFGGMAVVTGLALLPVGLGVDNGGLALAGGITLAAGAVLTTLGIIAINNSRATRQPGSAIRFQL